MTTGTTWDPERYTATAGFVTRAGDTLLPLLAAQPGERVLDIGCGTGDHVAALCAQGVLAQGVDADAAMIAQARARHPGCTFTQADVRALPWHEAFDALLSNACLHWIPAADAALAIARMRAALVPGGRLVVDTAADGNVAVVRSTVDQALAEIGWTQPWQHWYFPSPATYAALLEAGGLTIRWLERFPRPSPLPPGTPLRGWLSTFASQLLVALGDRREAVLARIEALAAPHLLRDGIWTVDYVRLRFQAIRTS